MYEKKRPEYIRASILRPNAVFVEGYLPDVMSQTFDERLSGEQVDEIIAYLSSVDTEE